jgi:hypothetical protein
VAKRKRATDPGRSEMELLAEISHKIDMLMGVIAIQGKNAQTQVSILTKIGLSGPEIGVLLDKSPDAVRHLRVRQRG